MEMRQIPTDLDWVVARSKCSIYEMFKKLRNEITEDVNKRNAAREGERVKFQLGALSANGFSVFREGSSGSASVDFLLSEGSVAVSNGNGGKMFTATVRLNDEGRCMFAVAGKELENWQLRRMALEEFFFTL